MSRSAISTQGRVYVHACGRLESLNLASPISVRQLVEISRQSFDFGTVQDLKVADKDGAEIIDDAVLEKLVESAGTAYIQVSDNAFHEFERRIHHLQHMQLGYLCEQLAVVRQEYEDVRADIRDVRLSMEAEQGARELGDDATRREIEDLRNVHRRQMQGGDEKIEAVELAVFDAKQAIREETLARETLAQETLRKFQETREALNLEGKAREHGDEKVRFHVEELRRAFELEVADREDGEVRADRAINDLREAIGDSAEGSVNDFADFRRQLLDLKGAIAMEQRERISSDSDIAVTIKAFRETLHGALRERSSDEARLLAKCSELDTSIEAERLARQQAFSELTQQMSLVVESVQEEQMLRSAEDAELGTLVEGMRKIVEDAKQNIEDTHAKITHSFHDMTKRFEEEGRSRRESEGKVGRTLATFQETVSDGLERRMRELWVRVENCRTGLEAEQHDRVDVVQELSERLLQQRKSLSEDIAVRLQNFDQLTEKVSEQAKWLKEEEQARLEIEMRVQQASENLVHEVQVNEKSRGGLSAMCATQKEQLEELGNEIAEIRGPTFEHELMHRIRSGCLEALSVDLKNVHEGMGKISDALQQERQTRTEVSTRMQAELEDALKKEAQARDEETRHVRKDIEEESHARQEIVEVIQQAIEDLRVGLETHSHDFDSDGERYED